MTAIRDPAAATRAMPAVPLTLGLAATPVGAHEVLNGRILFRVPGLARALVDAGGASIESEPGVSEEDLDWLARRHVRTAERLVQGKFALWAAAVVVDGKAVALIGDDASGKSTTAASLALRGCPILADAALEVEFDSATAVARATADRLELWPGSVRQLGLEPEDGEPVRAGLAKRAHRFPAARSAPLGTIAILTSSAETAEIKCEQLSGGRAIERIADATCMVRLVEPVGLRPVHFVWLTRLCAAVKVLRVCTSRFAPDVPAVTDAILAGIHS